MQPLWTGSGIWTATNQSSINRWEDVDTNTDILLPESLRDSNTAMLAASKPPQASIPMRESAKKKEVTAQSILRISNTAVFPLRRKAHRFQRQTRMAMMQSRPVWRPLSIITK